ncbi:MAG: type VI secretion system protein TssA [Candidatus Thiothrix putei]|uniref:Type VI secretion system protein TssA n=1 Tax=Candidatus Thiothrix putei TaxID=3080811 RepID=A0AA95KPV6_9GAMM|nr:MAG: type VI secretion system protein TssA [Candidatus Thiothrix putei]
MVIFDFKNLTQPLDNAAPCGQDVEYTALFREMEKAKQGEPERQAGTTIIPAEEPDWKTLKKQSLELSNSTRDLRVAVSLSAALLHTDGFMGFSQGLALIAKLLEQHWECLYPELDNDDPNPAMMRANTLLELAALPFLSSLRKQTLIHSKVLGKFSLQNLQEASDYKNASESEEKQKYQLVEAMFKEAVTGDTLTTTLQTLQDCLQRLGTINQQFDTHVGYANAPNLAPLRDTLNQAVKFIAPRIPPPPSDDNGGIEPVENPGGSLNGSGDTLPPPNHRDATMPIQSREEVLHVLEQICDYYSKYEPSSPVPILLKRVSRLVDKDFLAMMEDLYPDSLNSLEQILGIKH